MTLHVTCDDITTVYVDGINNANLPNLKSWNQFASLELPETFKVIAIKCENEFKRGGLQAKIEDTSGDIILKTDETAKWLCSPVEENKWESVDFKPSQNWKAPVVLSGKTALGATGASWIWTEDPEVAEEMFCRVQGIGNVTDIALFFVVDNIGTQFE